MNKYLKAITDLFPEWMEIYKDPEESTGGQFINSFCQFIENIDIIISDILDINNLYKPVIDYDGYQLSKIDYIGKVEILKKDLDNINEIWIIDNNEKKMVEITTSTFQFFFSSNPMAFYDSEENQLYINKLKDIYCDGNKFSYTPHLIWGPYDEIGLLINCKRQPLERNEIYRERLKSAWRSFGNSSPEKLKEFIIRSLFPFNSSLDDTVEFIELTDEYIEKTIEENGLTNELKKYLEQSNRINHLNNNSYWDVIDNTKNGIKFLPISWKKSLLNITEDKIENGVLQEDDLLISSPDIEEHLDNIEFDLYVKTPSEEEFETYKEQEFEYTISSVIDTEDIAEQEYGLEIEQSENINLEFNLLAQLSYKTLTTIYFNKDNNNFKIHYHIENDKEKNISLDKTSHVNKSFACIVKDIPPGETYNISDNLNNSIEVENADKTLNILNAADEEVAIIDCDTIDLEATLISENQKSPVLNNIYLNFEKTENNITSTYSYKVDLSTASTENISIEEIEGNERAKIENEESIIKIDDVEINRSKYSNLYFTRENNRINGFMLDI